MKTYTIKGLILLISLTYSNLSHAQNYAGESSKMLGDLKLEDDYQKFARCRAAILHDPLLARNARNLLKIKYWIMAYQFVRTHSYPQGQTYLNPPPPDGSRSGIAPEDIKDPVMRDRYLKIVADNEALSNAQTKHNNLSRAKDQLTSELLSYVQSEPEYLKTIPQVIKESTNNPDEAKELIALINQVALHKGLKPLEWFIDPRK
jgi:hypothetical protein